MTTEPVAPPPLPRTPSDLRKRISAGLAMMAVALVALWAGGFFFWLLMAVIAVFMMAEWSDLTGADARTKRLAQYALFAALAIMSPPGAGADPFSLGLLAGAGFFVVIVTRRPPVAAGVLYCGLPVLALVLIRGEDGGIVLTLWALALVWLTDIGAFFAGRSIGGPKLAPAISPAKTWSGLIGGVLAASLFGWALHERAGLPAHLAVATPFLAVLAQAGDLFESWLKRRAGVKDSGNVLPGHGGVLDRLDGMVPVAPVAALLVVVPRLLP